MNKHIQLFLLSSLIVCGPVHAKMADKYQPDVLGSQDISSKTQKKVDEILAELGFEGKMQVKQISDRKIKQFGNHNAWATIDTIFINEKTFNQLTREEQRFLIGHEVGHIKNKDAIRGLLVPTVGAFAIQAKLITSPNRLVRIMALPVGFVSAIVFGAAYQRYAEKRADRYAIEKLNCHDGAISWHRRFVPYSPHYSGLKGFAKWLLSSHPNHQERIAFAEQSKNNNLKII